MIEASAVKKSFGAVRALTHASVRAEDGQITGLLGPNGAGKSTLLRVISTLVRPDAGSVTVDGIDALADPVRARRQMGVLPHNTGLYPRLTGRENIRYFGRINGVAGSELERRVEALVKQLDMGSFADRPAKGYSQGQKLKVALGRAMVHDPRNVVLDEPTNGLDVMATRSLRELIRRLRDEGRCVLLSSHVMQEIASLCDNLFIIARGRLAATGSPDALRAATAHDSLEDAFVAALDRAESEEAAQ